MYSSFFFFFFFFIFLHLDQKYLDAAGIPVMSSSNVPDAALHQFAYVINMMLRKRPDIKQRLQRDFIKFIVIGSSERTSQMPEYIGVNEDTRAVFDYDIRTRGLGATTARPASSSSEENILCRPWGAAPSSRTDTYHGESITM